MAIAPSFYYHAVGPGNVASSTIVSAPYNTSAAEKPSPPAPPGQTEWFHKRGYLSLQCPDRQHMVGSLWLSEAWGAFVGTKPECPFLFVSVSLLMFSIGLEGGSTFN